MLFTYPLGTIPLALVEVDGTLKKTAKALLLHKPEDVEPLSLILPGCAYIVDGMAAVRQMKSSKMTYYEFSINLLNHVLAAGRVARRIVIVFDVYVDNSIKDVERNHRSQGNMSIK